MLKAGQPVGVGGPGQLGPGTVPVAGHQQRLGQVRDRGREQEAGPGSAPLGGGGPGRLRARAPGSVPVTVSDKLMNSPSVGRPRCEVTMTAAPASSAA